MGGGGMGGGMGGGGMGGGIRTDPGEGPAGSLDAPHPISEFRVDKGSFNLPTKGRQHVAAESGKHRRRKRAENGTSLRKFGKRQRVRIPIVCIRVK